MSSARAAATRPSAQPVSVSGPENPYPARRRRLPPLLLDDEEAIAVAISLHLATTGSVTELADSSLRALTKLHQMLPRSRPAAGRLEAAGPDTCIFHTGSNPLEELALYVAVKGFGFEVLDPPELAGVLHTLADRLRNAAGEADPQASGQPGPTG
jgi:hypothetical protein